MPLLLIAIGLGIAVASLASTGHSTWKTRKWKKIHDSALAEYQATEAPARSSADAFNQKAERLGRLRVNGVESLKEAADFLEKAKVKHREFEELKAAIPDADLARWTALHAETLKSLGIGAAGIAGMSGAATATVAGLYTAAGVFGVASTGTAISTLSGAAAQSARLAWLGGGALTAGGAGIAGGLSTLALSANIVAAPVGIAAAAWGQWKAEQTKRKVEDKLQEFARAEAKLRQKISVMQSAQPRMSELATAIREQRAALQNQLRKSEVDNLKDVHAVYKLAYALAQILEQPVLNRHQKEVLQG